MWALRGYSTCLLGRVGLGCRARAGVWHDDPVKAVRAVGFFFLSYGVYSDRRFIKVNCLQWVLTKVLRLLGAFTAAC